MKRPFKNGVMTANLQVYLHLGCYCLLDETSAGVMRSVAFTRESNTQGVVTLIRVVFQVFLIY